MTAKTNALPPGLDSDHEPHIEWLAERSDERLLLVWASAIAVIVHGLAFMIDLPEPTVVVPPLQPTGPTIYDFPIPPPPPPVAATSSVIDTTRRKLIPDRELDSLEPVTEPVLQAVDDDRFIEVELDRSFRDEPVPPPGPVDPPGPVAIGPDITQPILIEDSKVPPEYPELARIAKMSGDVIVQAVIHRDGSVGEVTILRCAPPGMGFEEAAIEAVRQWRYEPATQFDRTVEVYFTVYVSFELR